MQPIQKIYYTVTKIYDEPAGGEMFHVCVCVYVTYFLTQAYMYNHTNAYVHSQKAYEPAVIYTTLAQTYRENQPAVE